MGYTYIVTWEVFNGAMSGPQVSLFWDDARAWPPGDSQVLQGWEPLREGGGRGAPSGGANSRHLRLKKFRSGDSLPGL